MDLINLALEFCGFRHSNIFKDANKTQNTFQKQTKKNKDEKKWKVLECSLLMKPIHRETLHWLFFFKLLHN